VIIAQGQRVYWVHSEWLAFRVVEGSGRVERIVRHVEAPPRLSAAERQRYLSHLRRQHEAGPGRSREPVLRAGVLERLIATPFAPRRPAFAASPIYPGATPLTTVDAEGNVWFANIHRGWADESETQFTILSVEGQALGRLTIPAGRILLWAGRDKVALLAHDQNGVEQVQVFTVFRPPVRPGRASGRRFS
jgi:hypothetical protein